MEGSGSVSWSGSKQKKRIRIQEDQKHTDPPDTAPEDWFWPLLKLKMCIPVLIFAGLR